MEFRRFTTDGEQVLVNMDKVHVIVRSGDGYALTGRDGKVLAVVDGEELGDSLASSDGHAERELAMAVTRLTQALERLSVRIPTSIRMHL